MLFKIFATRVVSLTPSKTNQLLDETVHAHIPLSKLFRPNDSLSGV